jgi:hypothetical protein
LDCVESSFSPIVAMIVLHVKFNASFRFIISNGINNNFIVIDFIKRNKVNEFRRNRAIYLSKNKYRVVHREVARIFLVYKATQVL